MNTNWLPGLLSSDNTVMNGTISALRSPYSSHSSWIADADYMENLLLTLGALRSTLKLPKFMINDLKEVCRTVLAILSFVQVLNLLEERRL